MLFKNRSDAGNKLAVLLKDYRGRENVIVLGLPRGGVVTAFEIAKTLQLPLDVICPRKIGAPYNPELAIGAVTETGKGIFNDSLIKTLGVSKRFMEEEIARETQRAQQRLALFRKDRPPRNIKGKTVILVDDGLATGATMKAAIESVKFEGAKTIVVAVPVSPADTLLEIEQKVDKVVCLETPFDFQAIGQFYRDFSQVEDEEVLDLLIYPTPK